MLETEIHKTIAQIHEALEKRETELIAQAHQITHEKLKQISVQRDMIETIQAQLHSALHFVNESLHCGSEFEAEVLMMKSTVMRQIERLSVPFLTNAFKPHDQCAFGDMEFMPSKVDVTTSCQNYGETVVLDLSKCQVTINGDEFLEVNKEYRAALRVFDSNGKPWKKLIKSIEGELVSEITGNTTYASVSHRDQDRYDIKYKPLIKGRHRLHIKINGQDVSGSPYCVKAKLRNSVQALGCPIKEIGGLQQAHGITLNQRGELLVTSWDAHCVTMVSSRVALFDTFSSESIRGRFKNPHSITRDGDGNIFITNWSDDSVQKFTPKGEFVASIPIGNFNRPAGIAYNAVNKMLYLANEHGHRIRIMTPDNFTLISTFGEKGNKKGQFNKPWGIAFDSTGKVYVTDQLNHRVQVFTANAKNSKCLRVFGKHGFAFGCLHHPFGICIDSNDYVYISMVVCKYISVFTTEGKFVKIFGRLETPVWYRGIVIDECGVVYVTNQKSNSRSVLLF